MKLYTPNVPEKRFLVQLYTTHADGKTKSESFVLVDTKFNDVVDAMKRIVKEVPPSDYPQTVRVNIRYHVSGQKKAVKTKGFSFKQSDLKSAYPVILSKLQNP